MKKLITVFLALTMLSVLLMTSYACADAIPSSEPVKLTALIAKNALTKNLDEMQWLKELAAENGVEIIEWRQYTNDWGQVKPVLFASGDIPDLLFNATGSADFDMFKGLFEDLTPLIEQHAPNISRMFAEQPETLIRSVSRDGKIFGVGNYNAEQVTVHGSTLINKKWLDNLGLSTPTNWDELYDVLVAFRDLDPNGNGIADEIPMDFWYLSTYGAINLLGSTGIQAVSLSSSEGGYFAEDATVKNYYVDSRFKEFINYLHKLYSEGLLNPEIFTHDFGSMTTLALGEGKTARVGVQFFWDIPSLFGTELADQYITLPPLKMSATSTIEPRYSYETFKVFSSPEFAISMSSSCPEKATAMRFLDAFYAPRNSAQTLYGGISDGHIEDVGNGTFTVLPPADPAFSGTMWMWSNTLGPIGPYYVYEGLLNNAPDTDNAKMEKSVYNDAHARIDFKKDFFGSMYFKILTEDNDTLALNGANLSTDWVTWVVNGLDDATWEAHVNNMMNNGLKENLEIFQKYYNEFIATFE